jgi:hypothetical protein
MNRVKVHGARRLPPELAALGFQLTAKRRGGHPVIAHPAGVALAVAGTPSDGRALKNDVALAKRRLREAGVEPTTRPKRKIMHPGPRVQDARVQRAAFADWLRRHHNVPDDQVLKVGPVRVNRLAEEFLKGYTGPASIRRDDGGYRQLATAVMNAPDLYGIKKVEDNGRSGSTIVIRGKRYKTPAEPEPVAETATAEPPVSVPAMVDATVHTLHPAGPPERAAQSAAEPAAERPQASDAARLVSPDDPVVREALSMLLPLVDREAAAREELLREILLEQHSVLRGQLERVETQLDLLGVRPPKAGGA